MAKSGKPDDAESTAGDLLALDNRRCLHFLCEITGDDQLDHIFSKFCIGK